MDAALQWLIDFVNGFWTALYNALTWCFDTLSDVLVNVVSLIFEGIFTVIVAIVGSFDLSSLALSYASSWGLLPPQLVYVLIATGIPQGLQLLAMAYTIRFILNLIPAAFTRV